MAPKAQNGPKRGYGVEYDHAEPSCNKGSVKPQERHTFRFPKEVYKWYRSAVMHTGKVHIHKAFFMLPVALAIAGYAIWNTFDRLWSKAPEEQATIEQVQQTGKPATPAQNRSLLNSEPRKAMTTAEYIKTFEPRIQGYPHTASRYDEITKPVTAPYPAACVYSSERDTCKCYTQQATPFPMDKVACIRIAQNGYFLDWQPDSQRREGENRDDRG